jgi:hypothetical protein
MTDTIQQLQLQLESTYIDVNGIERSRLTQNEKHILQKSINDLQDSEINKQQNESSVTDDFDFYDFINF